MVSDAAVEGLSGAAGGILALVATYPLMTISTVQATRSKQALQGLPVANVNVRAGTLSDLSEVVREHGWTGLYRGLQASLLGTAVSQGIYFYFYSQLRQLAVAQQRHTLAAQANSQDIGLASSLAVAFLAGCGNVLLTNPIWVVATRMQALQKKAEEGQTSKPAQGPISVARDIWSESGILGFWRGCLPSLIMVSNPTVNYMFYEWLLARLASWEIKRSGKARKPSAAQVFAVSALAKLGATVCTYPLLLVKARLQSAGKHSQLDRQYTGTADAIHRIWKTEGFLGFYSGMRAKIVQSILAAALLMAIKEELTASMRKALQAPVVVKSAVR